MDCGEGCPTAAVMFGVPGLPVLRAEIDSGVWRCPERACAVVTFTETHEPAAPRSRLTRRATCCVTDAIADDDATVSALGLDGLAHGFPHLR